MLPGPSHESNFWDSWGLLEWLLGAGWAAGAAVAGSLWRLTVKVSLLEQKISDEESSVQLRHQENAAAIRQLQERVAALDTDYKVLISQIGRLATMDDWRKLYDAISDTRRGIAERIDRLKG